MAYVVTGIFLLLTGVFFSGVMYGNYATSYSSTFSETSLRDFLNYGVYFLLLFAAVLTMRLIAEERKIGTIELLLTAPVRDSEIIIGKFLGSLGLLTVMLGLTLYYPLMLIIFGDPDIGPIFTGYLGLYLLGVCCLSIGIFASTVTNNQIVSAVLAGLILFALWFVGTAASFLPENIGEIVSYFSFSTYYTDFITGIIDTRGIVFYLSISVLFLFLSIRSLENSRWN